MQQVLYKIYLDKQKPRRLERPKCHAVSSWRLASRPRPQLDSRTRLKKLSVESAESTHTGWQLTNGPLTLLRCPKTVTTRTKLYLKSQNFWKRALNWGIVISLTQLVLEVWLENRIHPFHDFYNFDQQIWQLFRNSQKNLKFHIFCHYFQKM